MKPKAVIYARANTSHQVKSKNSLAGQIENCMSFAKEKDLDVIGIYQDEVSGRTRMADRPSGSKLCLAIDLREIDVVIVSRLDRLSRDVKDLLATIQNWSKQGIAIYVLNEGQLLSEFASRLNPLVK